MKEKFTTWLQAAFENKVNGASARKLSAFSIMVCVLVAHAAWLRKAFMENDFTLLSTVLTIDYTFILTLLGLTTWQQIQKTKTDATVTIEETKSEQKTE
jgi:hypothetical protein